MEDLSGACCRGYLGESAGGKDGVKHHRSDFIKQLSLSQ